MARGARDDEDERLDRTETLLEKSDRLVREYSRDREVRQRTDRVRRIEPSPTSDTNVRAARPRSRAPTSPEDEGTQVQAAPPDPDLKRPPPARESPPPRPEPKKARIKTGDRPAVTPSQLPKERQEPLPSAPPVAPKPTSPAPRSALDQLAIELEELIRELRFGWRGLPAADRLTTGCALSVFAGVLMPWVSDPAHSLRTGLLSGGVVHLGIAVLSVWLVLRSSALRGLRMTRRDELAQHRRISLWLVLLGAASTGMGAYLLLLYGVQKSADWPVQLHLGLYWTLVSGTGLSYGGYARFSDARR